MTRIKMPAILLGATALTIPLAFAQAQQQVAAEGACEQLLQLIQQSEAAGEELLDEFRDARTVADAKQAEGCVVVIQRVATVGGITAQAQERGQGAAVAGAETGVDTETETFQARDRVTQTVEIEQEAIVEGQVTVRQPIPEIGIEQGTPQIEVSEAPVAIAIQEQPAEIQIRQAPATVRVEIPQPTITIEQPAPEIVITMPPPGVSLDRQQPQVSVVIPEPTVTVSQADPEVTADVQARFVQPGEAPQQQGQEPLVTTQTERLDAAGNPVEAAKEAEVTLRQAEAQVSFQPVQGEDQVRIEPAEPRVVFEPAEPNVEVTFAETANVQVQQVGEPTVRIVREGEQQAAAEGQQQAAAQGEQQAAAMQAQGQAGQAVEGEQSETTVGRLSPEDTSHLLGVAEGTEPVQGELVQVTASDIVGRDVVTLRGEEVGELDGFAQAGGQLYAIVAHGGFLGIGEDQIAVPAERIAVQGDQVLLLGLTEEQIEQMPEYDFNSDQEIVGTEVLEIGRYE